MFMKSERAYSLASSSNKTSLICSFFARFFEAMILCDFVRTARFEGAMVVYEKVVYGRFATNGMNFGVQHLFTQPISPSDKSQ